MNYKCEKCGCCCKNIYVFDSLFEFKKDLGWCIHLTADNLCNIYDTRPLICNVSEMYNKHFKDDFTESEFIEINKAVCRRLQERINLSR